MIRLKTPDILNVFNSAFNNGNDPEISNSLVLACNIHVSKSGGHTSSQGGKKGEILMTLSVLLFFFRMIKLKCKNIVESTH